MTAKEQPPMADRRSHLIFISYRGSDQNWATELVYARMTEAFGTDAVFKAGNAIRAGEDFPSALRREAASCPVMLACIGPGWLTATAPDGSRRLDSADDWVREEIAISLQAGNNVLPVLIGNRTEVTVPEPDLVPESIRAMVRRQAVWLAPGGGLDATIPMLVDRLAELVPELAERRSDPELVQKAQVASRNTQVNNYGGVRAGRDAYVSGRDMTINPR
jgi:TIR domain